MRRSYIEKANGNHNTSYRDTSQLLEEENEHLENELKGKVKALKTLTIDIGNEVREQNKWLDKMDDDMESSGGLLSKTMGRLKSITRAGHWKLWLYILAFVFFVFFMCWIIIRFR